MSGSEPVALSFSGCGFLGVYHFGAVDCLNVHAKTVVRNIKKFAGTSAGSLVAVVLAVCPDKLEESRMNMQKLADELIGLRFGALTPSFNLMRRLRELLDGTLPENAAQLANDRLFISVTRMSDKKNFLISTFPDRSFLIDTLIASSFIPVYAGIGEAFPLLNNEAYADGGLSDNLPKLPDCLNIGISPFSGEADISPRDINMFDWTMTLSNQLMRVNMSNVVRGAQALFPPKRHILEEYYKLGWMDTMYWLLQNDLLERGEGTEV